LRYCLVLTVPCYPFAAGRKKVKREKSPEEIEKRDTKVSNYKKVIGALLKRRKAALLDEESLSLTTKILSVRGHCLFGNLFSRPAILANSSIQISTRCGTFEGRSSLCCSRASQQVGGISCQSPFATDR
jgi:hypothetical protein